jgi:hypothetical protein
MRMIVVMMIMAAATVMIVLMLGVIMVVMGMVVMVMPMMIVPVVVVTMMRVTMCGLRLLRISAALRFEGAFDLRDLAAKLARHILNHLIAANANTIGQNLHGQMTIAQMPSHARQITRLCDADFGEWLGCRHHFDQAPIFEHKCIAMAQHDGFGQIKQEGEALHAGHSDPAAMTLFKIEHNRIGGRCLPCATGADEIRADHICLFSSAFQSWRV